MKLKAKFSRRTSMRTQTPSGRQDTRSTCAEGHGGDAAHAARNLALAHYIERLIDQRVLRDYSDAARALGVSQVRVSHLASLTLLAPAIQQAILLDGIEPTDKTLRAVARTSDWTEQLRMIKHPIRSELGS